MNDETIDRSEDHYFIRKIKFNSDDEDDDIDDEKTVEIYQRWNSNESGVVWDSSLLVAKYLEHQKNIKGIDLYNKNCLELGTGTGFLGIWLAALFDANVLVTDLETNLDLARKNIALNSAKIKDEHRIEIASFDWLDKQCYQWNFLDWRTLDCIDYVFIADCIYYDKGMEAIYNFIDWMLNTPSHVGRVNTKFFVSYEERDDSIDLLLTFYSMIKKNRSLKYEIITSLDLHPNYQSPDLHLMLISRH